MSDAVDEGGVPLSEPASQRPKKGFGGRSSWWTKWRRCLSSTPFVVCATVAAAGGAALTSPDLPRRLVVSGEVTLEVDVETISLEVENLQTICAGGVPVQRSEDAELVLTFDGCTSPALRVTAVQSQRSEACAPKGTAVLNLAAADECSPKLLIVGAEQHVERLLTNAGNAIEFALRPEAAAFGNLDVASVEASKASTLESKDEALLAMVSGSAVEMAASSMRLSSLALSDNGKVLVDFTDPDMGFVTHAEADHGWQLTRWRLKAFGIVLVGVLSVLLGIATYLREHPEPVAR